MSDIIELGTAQAAPQMSAQINEIAAALSKAQTTLGAASKDQSGYGYTYSDLAQVIASSKDALTSNGLSVVQLVGPTTDKVSLTTILTHSSGQFFRTESSIDLIDMKGCNKAQNAGASLSYLRRYAYQAIIGQPSEDNDGSSKGFDKSAKPAKKSGSTSAPVKAKQNSSGDLGSTKSGGSFRKTVAKKETSDDL